MALTLTKDTFPDQVLHSDKPVLVDFWAPWCGPCRMMSPVVDELAKERNDITVGKVNVDDEGDLAASYAVQSIPTLLLFRAGKVEKRIVGALPRDALLSQLAL
ncbi:MAG: thioredoxin [Spirochaetaceae bacterium]|jgi:thioredoxin 1|nr:thioredoxin [Spirochaetaceae bacterium]